MPRGALIIGEALVDVVRHSDGSSAAHPGGSPANVAIGLARLGRQAELLTSIGADAYGAVVRDHVEASGARIVDCTPAAHTSVATATLDARGVATYEFSLAWELSPDARVSPDPLVVHTGSIAAVVEPGASVVERLLREAHLDATITYDPNARPSLMGSPRDAAATIERIVALSDVVKVSDEDLAWLFPGEVPVEVARRWRALGPALVVVTLGAEGAVAVCEGGLVKTPPVRVAVADTVGAGDSFMSGLIDGLWSHDLLGGHRRAALGAIEADDVSAILARCARIAALTVSRAGANPPTLAELGEA